MKRLVDIGVRGIPRPLREQTNKWGLIKLKAPGDLVKVHIFLYIDEKTVLCKG